MTGGRAELHSHEEAIQDIWPLQLVDLGDDEQCGTLYRLLRRLPHVALHYLATHVFPTTCRHQGLKLSACGQALGGELLFKKRFGFSGTPSDLLPVELGQCHYEKARVCSPPDRSCRTKPADRDPRPRHIECPLPFSTGA